jgi:hypothetical protein
LKAVADGMILRPEHGIWLVEACGYLVGDRLIVTYATRACSLPRTDRIARERAFNKGRGTGGTAGDDQAVAHRRAAALFDYIRETNTGWLATALKRAGATTGYYRWLEDNGNTCHVELFVGFDRISVGSCYLRSSFDDATLSIVETVNWELEVDPSPDKRYLRGSWWDLRRDVGRNTPLADLPSTPTRRP